MAKRKRIRTEQEEFQTFIFDVCRMFSNMFDDMNPRFTVGDCIEGVLNTVRGIVETGLIEGDVTPFKEALGRAVEVLNESQIPRNWQHVADGMRYAPAIGNQRLAS